MNPLYSSDDAAPSPLIALNFTRRRLQNLLLCMAAHPITETLPTTDRCGRKVSRLASALRRNWARVYAPGPNIAIDE